MGFASIGHQSVKQRTERLIDGQIFINNQEEHMEYKQLKPVNLIQEIGGDGCIALGEPILTNCKKIK